MFPPTEADVTVPLVGVVNVNWLAAGTLVITHSPTNTSGFAPPILSIRTVSPITNVWFAVVVIEATFAARARALTVNAGIEPIEKALRRVPVTVSRARFADVCAVYVIRVEFGTEATVNSPIKSEAFAPVRVIRIDCSSRRCGLTADDIYIVVPESSISS
jgi:hypothetical protein